MPHQWARDLYDVTAIRCRDLASRIGAGCAMHDGARRGWNTAQRRPCPSECRLAKVHADACSDQERATSVSFAYRVEPPPPVRDAHIIVTRKSGIAAGTQRLDQSSRYIGRVSRHRASPLGHLGSLLHDIVAPCQAPYGLTCSRWRSSACSRTASDRSASSRSSRSRYCTSGVASSRPRSRR